MHAGCLLLGQIDQRWDMHQPEPILPMERRRESAYRLHDPYAQYTHDLAVEPSVSAEALLERDIPAGSLVGNHLPLHQTIR